MEVMLLYRNMGFERGEVPSFGGGVFSVYIGKID